MLFNTLRNPVIIFCLVFFTHFFSKVSYITDSRWTLHSCWAIAHHHDMRLDDFRSNIDQNHFYAIDEVNGHLYYSFPPGTPILCTPFFAMLEKFAKRVYYIDVFNNLKGNAYQGMELFLAALFTALTSVVLYLVLKQLQIDAWIIWLMIVLFSYGTSAWTVASRGLFAHGPSMLFLITAIWALYKSERNDNWLWLVGFLLGYSYIIRPTNSISIAVLGLYILWQYRLHVFKYAIPLAGVIALFFIRNLSVYGHLLTPYYQPSHLGTENHLLEGLAGNLFSPNRGLFNLSPFLLFLFPAVFVAIKKRKFSLLLYALLALVVLHTLLISYFDNWYAGWCFGPRYFTDIMPVLVVLLAFGLQQIFTNITGFIRITSFSLFLILGSVSCFIHYKGANELKTEQWNYLPNNIDEHRERTWDWNDLQFLR